MVNQSNENLIKNQNKCSNSIKNENNYPISILSNRFWLGSLSKISWKSIIENWNRIRKKQAYSIDDEIKDV